jgi:hypothetical protein
VEVKIIAIDPGQHKSGVVRYDAEAHCVESASLLSNEAIHAMLRCSGDDDAQLVMERLQSRGNIAGTSTFETIEWYGRFREAWEFSARRDETRKVAAVFRRDVQITLCGGTTYRHPDTGKHLKVGDTEVRRAVIDRFPADGGGSRPQIGTKKQPGPLHGVGKDMWSAVAVAITYAERELRLEPWVRSAS